MSKKSQALFKLGGVVCRGLSFIGGPECPVPTNLLKEIDINIGHRKSAGARGRNRHRYREVLRSRNPQKKFILLCTLCNQRMRHLCGEFSFVRLPLNKVIGLYTNKNWTLEEIALQYGCSDITVSNFLKRNNVSIRKNQGGIVWSRPKTRKILLHERNQRYITPQRLRVAKQMLELWLDGLSLREVGQFMLTTKNSVRTHLRLLGEIY